jgi:GNAT superfamily N-acetyltransferase
MIVAFRMATRGDVSEIMRLLADNELGGARESRPMVRERCLLEAFDAIDADPRQTLVATEVDDGRIIGTPQLSFIPCMTFAGGTRAQIEGVRVDSSTRGNGIGRRMMEWSIDRARDHGCHMVQLTTNTSRTDARRFYETLEFVATHDGMKLQL